MATKSAIAKRELDALHQVIGNTVKLHQLVVGSTKLIDGTFETLPTNTPYRNALVMETLAKSIEIVNEAVAGFRERQENDAIHRERYHAALDAVASGATKAEIVAALTGGEGGA